ncbi:hypothetical protein G3N95_12030 [Paraburkholderia sp. Tr-20389]|nr:hypothetical protein [Paraburkholderia sp. Tr-20389]
MTVADSTRVCGAARCADGRDSVTLASGLVASSDNVRWPRWPDGFRRFGKCADGLIGAMLLERVLAPRFPSKAETGTLVCSSIPAKPAGSGSARNSRRGGTRVA